MKYKVKGKEIEPFECGMSCGVLNAALDDVKHDNKSYLRQTSYCKDYEIKSFNNGFKLGGKYMQEWKDNKRIFFTAVKQGDIIPVGWKIGYQDNRVFIDID